MDTSSTLARSDVRRAVLEAAIERRLLTPGLHEDVLFEVMDAGKACRVVSERAKSYKSI